MGGRAPLSPEETLLLLRILPGVGDRGRHLLFAQGASRREAVERALHPSSPIPAASRRLLRDALAGSGEGAALRSEIAQIQTLAKRFQVRILGMDEPDYPARLHSLHDPPAVLFLRGRLELLNAPMVAVVGSRRSTPTGRRRAYGIARELAGAGVTVLSGMALGIDGAAHRGGLDGVGSTAAVLGRGPDRAYPLTHAQLFQRVASDGLLISEFPPGTGARTYHFPRRNRILATLPRGVVVVEARERSGALLTADFALDVGVDVMVATGADDHAASAGSKRLHEEGAERVASGADVLACLPLLAAELGLGPEASSADRRDAAPPMGPNGEDEGDLTGHLSHVPVDENVLLARTGLPLPRLAHALLALELRGMARREGSGWVRWPPGP